MTADDPADDAGGRIHCDRQAAADQWLSRAIHWPHCHTMPRQYKKCKADPRLWLQGEPEPDFCDTKVILCLVLRGRSVLFAGKAGWVNLEQGDLGWEAFKSKIDHITSASQRGLIHVGTLYKSPWPEDRPARGHSGYNNPLHARPTAHDTVAARQIKRRA